MQRIATVVQTSGWGGIHEVLVRVAPLCRESGVEIVALLGVPDDAVKSRLAAAGVEAFDCPMARLRRTYRVSSHASYIRRLSPDLRRLAATLRTIDPDGVQLNGIHHLHGFLAAGDRPILWQIHSDQVPLAFRMILGPILASQAKVVMTSGADLISRFPGITGRQVVPFMAPVDTKTFSPDMAEGLTTRRALGYGPSDVVIGTVGGRGPNKSHHVIVEIVRALRVEGYPVSGLIVGSSQPQHSKWYRQNVEVPARSVLSDWPGSIQILDGGKEVSRLLRAMDVFVLPSKGEGASLALGEAMATALPAVVNDVGSVRSSVAEGETGFVNRSCSVSEMKSLVRQLVDDEGLRRRMGDQARAFAERELTIEACAQSHLTAYRLLLDSRSARSA